MASVKVKQRLKSAAAILAVLFLILLGVLTYSKYLNKTFQEEIISSMDEISGISARSLQQRLEAELYSIEHIADLICPGSGKKSINEMVEHLKNLRIENRYVRFGVMEADGVSLTTDDLVIELADREFFKQALEGNTTLSDTLTDRKTGKLINVYATPVYDEKGEIYAILYGTKDNGDYRNSLEVKSFNGAGYSYVVKKNGNTVVDSSHETSFTSMSNIFLSMSETKEDNTACIIELKEQMEAGNTGSIIFKNKVTKYLYYRPIGINDWYLLTVVPISVTNKKLDAVMKANYTLCGAIILLTIGLLGTMLFIQDKGKRKLEGLLYIDSITGGDSFAKFKKNAAEKLEEKGKYKYAIMDIDVDKFKFINDSFGYEEGNQAIMYIWSRLKDFAVPDDLIAHKAADSFVALLQYENISNLRERVEHFCSELNRRQKEKDKQYEIVPSVGLYVIQDTGKALDTMLDRAAIAKQSIKGKQHQWFAFYDDDLRLKLLKEKHIADRMTDALKNQEFFVNYQPQYDAVTGRPTGAEALVRWRDSEQGILYPKDFISVFESNGLITELDKYVFEQVCMKMKEWLERGINVVPVSVNLSRIHLFNKNFVKEYIAIRNRYHLPEELVHLELTESALFEQEEYMAEMVKQLHESGFQVLMDDFGTGYSSLHMLKKISIDVLKLDKKFVDDIGDPRSDHVIESIIKLAHSLDMSVTAEGVEESEQYEFLKEMGCDEIQGYYFSKPVNVEAYEKILTDQKI